MTALTTRETDVMRLICEGLTAQGIGEVLGISSRTVEIHRRRAIIKLCARNQTHAAVLFDRHRTASAPADLVEALRDFLAMREAHLDGNVHPKGERQIVANALAVLAKHGGA
jgi:DNA-binding CsgD family transcriptional regulator